MCTHADAHIANKIYEKRHPGRDEYKNDFTDIMENIEIQEEII